ncbi:S-adenosyl-L-methionine-dependent methyltransferase [Xylaria bambusicola]|uniref:S-adenosyl-L-methionine-dependent methyltransferase n=1 Tax=Xylaria bambusicola TaxID=326684 RepID=UPI0020082EFA|nr:S-adenosyl-L-methionine-dependent methyltransferase [Xylaria bambusicola]KAI0508622.1 S-adenosyl-L-methionine-dependent methyltransferase [Xylaria bambusicola]
MTDNNQRYVMDENEGELERLGQQHTLLHDAMGKLVFAPVDLSKPGRQILDSGTADGLWLRELRDTTNASHTYIGVDINPAFFPKDLPSEIELHVQSITNDWPDHWRSRFDLVHQRLTLVGAGSSSVQSCVSKLADLASPGGYVELVEADFAGESSNGPAMEKFQALMGQFFDVIGVGSLLGRSLEAYLEGAGLVNGQQGVFIIPYGAANSNATLCESSISQLVVALNGIWPLVNGRSASDSSAEHLESFRNELVSELRARGANVRMVVAWAKKP